MIVCNDTLFRLTFKQYCTSLFNTILTDSSFQQFSSNGFPLCVCASNFNIHIYCMYCNGPMFRVCCKLTDMQIQRFLECPQSQWDRSNGWDSDKHRWRLFLWVPSSTAPMHPGKLYPLFGSCRVVYRDRTLDRGHHSDDLLHETTWTTTVNRQIIVIMLRYLVLWSLASVINYWASQLKLNCLLLYIFQTILEYTWILIQVCYVPTNKTAND